MIARNETQGYCERILTLLEPFHNDACVSGVFADIAEIQRLLEYYSFRTPHLADRFADRLSSRYRYEIFAIYGTSELLRRQTESSYLRLEQLLPTLVRVALMRLCCEGKLSLSRTQVAQSDGMLYLALKKERGLSL